MSVIQVINGLIGFIWAVNPAADEKSAKESQLVILSKSRKVHLHQIRKSVA
jgi:hypothetical protein